MLRRAVESDVELPVLRWLAEQGAPWDGEAVARARRGARGDSRFGDAAAWLEARLDAAAGQAGLAVE